MVGEKDTFDIIDSAMKADDTDYGDREVATQDDQGEQGGDQRTGADVQTREQDSSVPARVPDTGDRSNLPAGQGQPQTGLRRVGAEFADAKGNIVDKTGKVIAPSGIAARFWQEASRASAQLRTTTGRLQAAEGKLREQSRLIAQATEIANLPAKLGISREDYNEGIALMSNWRKDPVAVAKEIVARTLSFGYNVTDILGKNVGDAIDTRAIALMVKDATAPLKQQQEVASRTAENQTRAQAALDNFRATHEHADTHGEAIARLMKSGTSPESAYLQLENFALRNGLDFSQPLGPQVEATVNGGNGNGQPTARRSPAPMVNGSRGSQEQLTTQTQMADAGDTWGDILNSVMKE